MLETGVMGMSSAYNRGMYYAVSSFSFNPVSPIQRRQLVYTVGGQTYQDGLNQCWRNVGSYLAGAMAQIDEEEEQEAK